MLLTKKARKVKLRRKRLSSKKQVRARKRRSKKGKGYEAGYNDALRNARIINQAEYQQGYELGYRQGAFAGGEGLVESALPPWYVLPDHTLEDVVRAGVEKLLPIGGHLLVRVEEVFQQIKASLDSRSPLSIVRLGDGESLTLAQELVMSTDQIRQEGHFLDYAGVDIPDLEARNWLAEAVRGADIVGIPTSRKSSFQPLLVSSLRAHGIDFRSRRLTVSTINYLLYEQGCFSQLLAGRRVLLVGNQAPALADVLRTHGIAVTGIVAPVNGVKDVLRVMGEIAKHDYDIALVAAGIPAVIIAQRIASDYGKIAIDFGHLAKKMVNGEAPFR